jgi:hypothetical protein
MARYHLAPHVYLCVTEDHVVLLDLRRDKYIGVGRAQMKVLSARVKGWPPSDPGSGGQSRAGDIATARDERAESILEKMLATGMLTTDEAGGKDATPCTVAPPQESLAEGDLETQPNVKFVQVVRFLSACAVAKLVLRWHPIESVVARVRGRRERCNPRASAADIEAARELTQVFIHLRPLLFGAHDACLFDSFALLEFLSHYSLYPSWVFGVQTGPFAAHCWVQDGAVVFNDVPERVRRFTPILAV